MTREEDDDPMDQVRSADATGEGIVSAALSLVAYQAESAAIAHDQARKGFETMAQAFANYASILERRCAAMEEIARNQAVELASLRAAHSETAIAIAKEETNSAALTSLALKAMEVFGPRAMEVFDKVKPVIDAVNSTVAPNGTNGTIDTVATYVDGGPKS